jgi:hypothetical protein
MIRIFLKSRECPSVFDLINVGADFCVCHKGIRRKKRANTWVRFYCLLARLNFKGHHAFLNQKNG